MKRRLLLAAAFLLLWTGSASAAGINLGWNDCPGGATYSQLKTFACDTNTGIHTLVVSYVAPANVLAILLSPATAWHVRWQGWSPPEPHFQCPSIVPARTRTWSSIKTLYR